MEDSECGREKLLDKIKTLEIVSWRIPEIILFLLLNVLCLFDVLSPDTNQITPPSVSVTISNQSYTIFNADHSFPLSVDGQYCYQADFEDCPNSGSLCCDANSFEETVDDVALYIITLFVPPMFLVVRYFYYKFVLKKEDAGRHIHAWTALFACWFLMQLSNNVAKAYVGYPRPCYYALVAFFELIGESDDKANRSFPSGHALFSMGSLLYVALLFLEDSQAFLAALIPTCKGVKPILKLLEAPCRTTLQMVALLPICLAMWVGTSRIKDFMHFPADVVGGWIFGSISAFFSYKYIFSQRFTFENTDNYSESLPQIAVPSSSRLGAEK
mmetsp:Transcript_36438/g.46406  ORF Transcript_36438/g.46406 Transcript_36438/m.46406 type:complete len:328 (-) Transcript_36438:190-1173(-)|eukprot:CAMPEP_0117790934 /NCGR_PEP_ID=MMETSP0948-20121206/8563_1 /TAXON_ID=44440 /ORGANISM="Chattonella subsalsa, Strain CCMP2191" /LENGTH=327 /DNA_ID=CAMNT_0005620903 /DNA_START=39 /DNA_END=1022 /DNA_ORIENTATION=+